MKQLGLIFTLISTIVLFLFIGANTTTEKASPVYEDVKSIFEDKCIMCHNGPKAPKGLQLTGYELLLKGSENGPVVVAGEPQSSEIVKRLRGISKPRMPFGGDPLADENIKLIEDWIAAGAKDEKPLDVQSYETHREVVKKEGTTFSDVRPIFKMRCERCHTESGLMGAAPEGFMVTTYESILDSRDRVRVVPGNPAASELLRKVRGQSLPRMPFDGPPYLSEDEIKLLEQWVEQGAMDDKGRKADIPQGAKVRLHGRLTGLWVLDDLPLLITGQTEIKKRTSVGDYVEVRGRVTSQGTISVERVRER